MLDGAAAASGPAGDCLGCVLSVGSCTLLLHSGAILSSRLCEHCSGSMQPAVAWPLAKSCSISVTVVINCARAGTLTGKPTPLHGEGG